jgi:hypothetical protein
LSKLWLPVPTWLRAPGARARSTVDNSMKLWRTRRSGSEGALPKKSKIAQKVGVLPKKVERGWKSRARQVLCHSGGYAQIPEIPEPLPAATRTAAGASPRRPAGMPGLVRASWCLAAPSPTAKLRKERLAGSELALSGATLGAARLSNLLQICSSAADACVALGRGLTGGVDWRYVLVGAWLCDASWPCGRISRLTARQCARRSTMSVTSSGPCECSLSSLA